MTTVLSLVRNADALGLDPTNTTFYCDSVNGNDTHDGRSLGTAWKSFEHALGYMASLRWAGVLADGVGLELEPGAYTHSGNLPTFVGCSTYYVYGNSDTPDDIVLTCSGAFVQQDTIASFFYNMRIKASYFQSSYGFVEFGGTVNLQLTGSAAAAFSAARGQLWIAGGNDLYFDNPAGFAVCFQSKEPASLLVVRDAVNFHTNGAFWVGTVQATLFADSYVAWVTWGGTGTVTGPRYSLSQFGRCWTNGGGANYITGNAVGANDGSGTYF